MRLISVLFPGKRVQFHGLVSRNDLNGKRGTIFEWLDSRQRYNVRLGSMSNEVRVPPSFAHSSSHPSPSADDCCEGMQPLRNRDRCDQRMVRGCFAPLVSLSTSLTFLSYRTSKLRARSWWKRAALRRSASMVPFFSASVSLFLLVSLSSRLALLFRCDCLD